VGTNARVAKESHTIEELESVIRHFDDVIAHAEPGSRPHTEAVTARRHYARRLEAAQEREDRRKRDDERDAHDIAVSVVDRLMGH
jgi:hypothetical protein